MTEIRFISYGSLEQLKVDLALTESNPALNGPEPGVAAVISGLDGDTVQQLAATCHARAVPCAGGRWAIAGNRAAFDVVLSDDGHELSDLFRRRWEAQFSRPRYELQLRNRSLDLSTAPLVMGILNVTPDSFSDGGRYQSLDTALSHAGEMIEAGAHILDIGGESSRPGAEPVFEQQELDRVLPVIEAITKEWDIPVSIDTYKASVARAAIGAGAHIINDISGFHADEDMAATAAELGVPIVLMHMLGVPKTMQIRPEYEDFIGEIFDSLAHSLRIGQQAGVARTQMIIDPGIGFGKTRPDNFVLLRRLEEFHALGCPMLVGASRKSFIGWALNNTEQERLAGSLAAAASAVLTGAHIIRVHDVKASKDAVEIAWRIRTARS